MKFYKTFVRAICGIHIRNNFLVQIFGKKLKLFSNKSTIENESGNLGGGGQFAPQKNLGLAPP